MDPHSLNLKDHFHLNQQQQQISSLKATTNLPPPLRPPKSKFLSISQPSSAASSPRLVSKKKKPKGDHPQVEITGYLEKSKSCGEGRACAPSEELEDLWFANPTKSTTKDAIPNKINQSPSRIHKIEPPEIHINNNSNNNENKGFKCCLYLPGFGKAKPVRAIRKEESNSNHKMSTTEGGIAISRTVSLEKFECGSWAPSPRAVIQASDAVAAATTEVDDSISSYFDLPSELIRFGGGGEDDAHSPVTAAFVFEKDIKGVLKNGSCRGNGNNNGGRKSDASPRHVRFSTSSATSSPTSPASACITPRLRKARDEFNAFLEAQSA